MGVLSGKRGTFQLLICIPEVLRRLLGVQCLLITAAVLRVQVFILQLVRRRCGIIFPMATAVQHHHVDLLVFLCGVLGVDV